MKNLLKLTKKFSSMVVVVTVFAVTFFITGAVVLAQYQGPPASPPEGNPPGFIFNNSGQEQDAQVNITGPIKVQNGLIVSEGTANEIVVGSGAIKAPQICLPPYNPAEDCVSDWGTAIGSSFWVENGTYLYSTNSALGTYLPTGFSPQDLALRLYDSGKARFGFLNDWIDINVSYSTASGESGNGGTGEGDNLIVAWGDDANDQLQFVNNINVTGDQTVMTLKRDQVLANQRIYAANGIQFPRNTTPDGISIINSVNSNRDLLIQAQQNLFLLSNEQPSGNEPTIGDVIVSRDSEGYALANPYLVVKSGDGTGNIGIGTLTPTSKLTIKDDQGVGSNILFDQGSQKITFDGFQGVNAGYTRWYLGHNIQWNNGTWLATDPTYRSMLWNDNGTLRFAHIPAGATSFTHAALQATADFSVDPNGNLAAAGNITAGGTVCNGDGDCIGDSGSNFWVQQGTGATGYIYNNNTGGTTPQNSALRLYPGGKAQFVFLNDSLEFYPTYVGDTDGNGADDINVRWGDDNGDALKFINNVNTSGDRTLVTLNRNSFGVNGETILNSNLCLTDTGISECGLTAIQLRSVGNPAQMSALRPFRSGGVPQILVNEGPDKITRIEFLDENSSMLVGTVGNGSRYPSIDNRGFILAVNNQSPGGSGIYLDTTNTNKVGFVGIGTADPAARLHVAGNTFINGAAFFKPNPNQNNGGNVEIESYYDETVTFPSTTQLNDPNRSNYGGIFGGGIRVNEYFDGSTMRKTRQGPSGTFEMKEWGDWTFALSPNGAAGSDAIGTTRKIPLTIKNDGRIGINTSDNNWGDGTMMEDNNTGLTINSVNGNSLDTYSGTTYANRPPYAYSGLRIWDNGIGWGTGNQYWGIWHRTGKNDAGVTLDNAFRINYYTGAANGTHVEAFTINPNGNVGIGINNPTTNLSVNGEVLVTGKDYARVTLGHGPDNPLSSTVWVMDNYYRPGDVNDDKLFRIFPQSSQGANQPNWGEYFSMDTLGNVGIGTTPHGGNGLRVETSGLNYSAVYGAHRYYDTATYTGKVWGALGSGSSGVKGFTAVAGASAGFFTTNSDATGGYGVYASASGSSGIGVFGSGSGANGIGVRGSVPSGSTTAWSGYFTGGKGVYVDKLCFANGECKTSWSGGIVSACTPNCSGLACGDDGCGGSCGSCATGELCSAIGQCVVVNPKSDSRLKDVEGKYEYGLDEILALNPIVYRFKPENFYNLSTESRVGLIAQDVQPIIPEAVTKDENGYLGLNQESIIYAMLNAIKEQQEQIVELKVQIDELKGLR